MNKLIGILAVIFCFGCQTRSENKIVVKTHYNFQGTVVNVDSLVLEIIDQALGYGSIVTFRSKSDMAGGYLPHFVKVGDLDVDYRMINGDTVALVDSKVFVDRDEKVEVKKYWYDLKDEIDEEGFYFLKDDFYVVGFYSTAWGLYEVYEYEESTLGAQLIRDNTGFFNSRTVYN